MKEASYGYDTSLITVFRDIINENNELNRLKELNKDLWNNKEAEIKQLNKAIELKEMELSRSSIIFNSLKRTITFQDIYKELTKSAVFIDITNFPK
jgi:hypothetical protein